MRDYCQAQVRQSLGGHAVLLWIESAGEVLSTHAEPNANNNYLSVYTNYDTAASVVFSDLEFTLCREDGTDVPLTYPLDVSE